MTQFVSLSERNQFSFTCPVFNTKTRMGACVKLRDKVWRGETPEVRRGCQAAMKCNKCPAAEMVRKFIYNKNFTDDHHGSVMPKEGKLMRSVLESVRPSMMREDILREYSVPDAERMLLLTANDRIDDQLRTAPGTSSVEGSAFVAPKPRRQAVKAPSVAPSIAASIINQAAATGNMVAAINS